MTKIVVVGAGPAGIMASFFLKEKKKKKKKIEKKQSKALIMSFSKA